MNTSGMHSGNNRTSTIEQHLELVKLRNSGKDGIEIDLEEEVPQATQPGFEDKPYTPEQKKSEDSDHQIHLNLDEGDDAARPLINKVI